MFQNTDNFNQILTDYAQGIWLNPGEGQDLASLFFAPVPVDEAVGQYDVYDTAAALSAVDATLPRDNSPRRIQLNRKQDFYSCKPQALEIATWKPALLQKSGIIAREDAVRTLMSAQYITRQVQAVSKVKQAVSSISFTSGTLSSGPLAGAWSAPETDLLGQIEHMCETVAASGVLPTHIVIGHAAWNILRNHPKLQGRFHALDYALKEDAFLSMLAYRGIKLVISETSALVGGSMVNLLDKDVVVMHREDAPSRTDMSMGKDFTLSPNGPEVITYNEHGIADVDVLLWSSDMKITNSAGATRLVVA